MYSSENKKGSRDQSKKESQKEEDCGEEEEENIRVPPTALR